MTDAVSIVPKSNAAQRAAFGKPSSPNRVAPKLVRGNDDIIARELEVYISDAENGLRAILKVGFFLECIAANLKHGELGPWVEAHCPNRSWSTVQRWQKVAVEIGEIIGMKREQRIELRLHESISLPLDQVPEPVRPFREKLDVEIAGKSYRQLLLKFEGASPKQHHPRKQLTPEQIVKAEMAQAEALLEAMLSQVRVIHDNILAKDSTLVSRIKPARWKEAVRILTACNKALRPLAKTKTRK